MITFLHFHIHFSLLSPFSLFHSQLYFYGIWHNLQMPHGCGFYNQYWSAHPKVISSIAFTPIPPSLPLSSLVHSQGRNQEIFIGEPQEKLDKIFPNYKGYLEIFGSVMATPTPLCSTSVCTRVVFFCDWHMLGHTYIASAKWMWILKLIIEVHIPRLFFLMQYFVLWLFGVVKNVVVLIG